MAANGLSVRKARRKNKKGKKPCTTQYAILEPCSLVRKLPDSKPWVWKFNKLSGKLELWDRSCTIWPVAFSRSGIKSSFTLIVKRREDFSTLDQWKRAVDKFQEAMTMCKTHPVT